MKTGKVVRNVVMVVLFGFLIIAFAVTGITKSTALEFGSYGIRVNSIHPGVIATPMVRNAPETTQRRLEVLMVRQSIPRPGTAEEVAKLALFLASDASSHVSGSEVWIDGAQSLLVG